MDMEVFVLFSFQQHFRVIHLPASICRSQVPCSCFWLFFASNWQLPLKERCGPFLWGGGDRDAPESLYPTGNYGVWKYYYVLEVYGMYVTSMRDWILFVYWDLARQLTMNALCKVNDPQTTQKH